MAQEPNHPDPAETSVTEVLKTKVDNLLARLLDVEKEVRLLKDHPDIKEPDTFPGQHAEMVAQAMLAVRHIEDARMRLGKLALQYGRAGEPFFDWPEPER